MSIGILSNVNSTKQKREANPGTSVCSRITGLTNNQTKSPKRATIPKKDVPQLRCVSKDSEPVDSERGKQSRGNLMQKVLGSIRKVRFIKSTLRQASIQENKGPSLGKVQVKHPYQRSHYAMKFETDLKKRLQDNTVAPKARHGILPKIFASSKKRTRLHSTRLRKSGYSRLRQ